MVREFSEKITRTFSEKVCKNCGKTLLKLTWSNDGKIKALVCDDASCSQYASPQGMDKG